MLELNGVRAGYGAQEILHGLTFSVPTQQIVAIVGVNGAGKSTTLKVISGLLKAREGTVSVNGTALSGGSAAEAVKAGIAHVPEGRQVFPNMSVRENLLLGAYTARRAQTAERIGTVLDIFPELTEKIGAYAGSLSGGQQQMMAIGRGLMSDPDYLLLDEPSLGLSPRVTRRIFEVIGQLRDRGKGVLLVEQNGRLALELAGHALLLERGTITLTGSGKELLANNEVVERYLGVGTPQAAADRQQDWTRALTEALANRD